MSNYLTLIIVDDERIIREGLRDMVDWHKLGFHVEACLDDGKDAIDYLASNPTDAVLTDIKMDDVSGIEVSRYIAENLLDTKVIVLSGYRDFSYAQQAVEYNVSRYLVKPVDFSELETTFLDLKKEIQEERGRSVATGNDGHRWEELLPQARRQFFADLVGGRVSDIGQIEEQCRRLEFAMTPDQHPCCLLRMALHIEAQNLSESARLGMLKTITTEAECAQWYEIQYRADRLVALAIGSTIMESDQFEQVLIEQLNTLCVKVKTVFHANLDMEVIAAFPSLNALASSGPQNLFERGASETQKVAGASEGPIVERVLHYLSRNYGAEVSLSSAAEKAYLSPVYFSKYIKEQTGKTFTEHLTAVRVKKAIELLRESHHSIGQIASVVGYANPRYFSRVFRKQTGYGPREYRNRVLAKEIADD